MGDSTNSNLVCAYSFDRWTYKGNRLFSMRFTVDINALPKCYNKQALPNGKTIYHGEITVDGKLIWSTKVSLSHEYKLYRKSILPHLPYSSTAKIFVPIDSNMRALATQTDNGFDCSGPIQLLNNKLIEYYMLDNK